MSVISRVSSAIANHLAGPVVVQSGDAVYSFPTPEGAREFEATVKAEGGDTVHLAPEVLPAARPLYDIEEHLALLIDSEETVPPELEEEYARDLQAAMTTAVDKRDRVGHFMAHLETQAAFAKAEIQRLQERERFYAKALERMEAYVTGVIEKLGFDAKGKRLKLEGNTVTFSLRGCDKRAEIVDEMIVPTKYKRVTITLPAESWELVCDSLDLDLRDQILGEVKSPKVDVSVSMVKADLKAEVEVPGAKLAGGQYLVRK